MPIRPENKARYPSDWPAISRAIKDSAGWRCEECGAVHGQPNPVTGSKVVLTTSHTDHQPENCNPSNLRSLCQKCHFDHHRATMPKRKTARPEHEKQMALPLT